MMSDILTIAHLTLFEARRKRIVTAALLCGAAFLTVFAIGMFAVFNDLTRRQVTFVERQTTIYMLTLAGLYAVNFLTVLFAVLLPVDAISGEIDSGVLQTIASKPIRRSDVVLGKWLGHGLVVAIYLLILCAGVLLTGRLIAGHVQQNTISVYGLMLLEMTLLMTVSVAGGTRLSTVTNGIAALGFYGVAFIGGWVEQIGGLAGIQSARTVGVVVSLISPADTLWRLSAYLLQPPILRDIGPGPFTVSAVPSPLMVWWAAGFGVVMLCIAVRSFETRQL
jgi:ABC-type transport system involved in multi-copper enzyme maturation permease subunit